MLFSNQRRVLPPFSLKSAGLVQYQFGRLCIPVFLHEIRDVVVGLQQLLVAMEAPANFFGQLDNVVQTLTYLFQRNIRLLGAFERSFPRGCGRWFGVSGIFREGFELYCTSSVQKGFPTTVTLLGSQSE